MTNRHRARLALVARPRALLLPLLLTLLLGIPNAGLSGGGLLWPTSASARGAAAGSADITGAGQRLSARSGHTDQPPLAQASAPVAPLDRLQETYGQLPLSFSANQGQRAAPVDFLAQGKGYSLFLTPGEAVLTLAAPAAAAAASVSPVEGMGPSADPAPAAATAANLPSAGPSAVLRLQLVGATPTAKGEGRDQLPGTVNYFRGNNPTKRHTNIPTYAKVAYTEVYPGVDLVYYGTQDGQLEYDFVVAPGADPGQIALQVLGAAGLALNGAGELVLSTAAGGEVRQRAPRLYQEQAGGARREVAGGYVLEGEEVRFWVGAYDPSQPLVLDPVLVYSTYLGGSNPDHGRAIAVDGLGQAYVTGQTSSADFPTTPGAFDSTHNGGAFFGSDVYVSKLNATGTALLYTTFLGGNTYDNGHDIAVDGAGNAYVTGTTESVDFPTTPGAFDTSFGGVYDVYVSKLNATGTALLYSTFLGGSSYDYGTSIAVDGAGSAYATGITRSVDFPTTPGAFDTSWNGSGDTYVSKLNAAGAALLYSTFLGSGGSGGIAVDGAGNAYVTGGTIDLGFPTTPGAIDTSWNGGSDAFVSKLNAAGTTLLYSTFLGGDTYDTGWGIAVDGAGNAYVTGNTSSTDFPTTPDALDTSWNGGGTDAFVSKLNAAGNALLYSTFLGGSDSDYGYDLAVDGAGNAYVTGSTSSADFPTTPGAFDTTYNDNSDVYVSKLSTTGTPLLYATFLGGSSYDIGYGIAVVGAGNAYVTGETGSVDFPTTPGAYDTSLDGSDGFSDVIVAKLSTVAAPLPVVLVSASDPTAAEAGLDPGSFTLTRSGDTSAPLTVLYTVGGSTSPDGDYVTLPGTITFPVGASSVAVTVTPLSDILPEPSETVVLTLSPGTSYQLGDPSSATVTLADNDQAPPVSLTVNSTADTVAADGVCTLREAITAANTNAAVNECPSGSSTSLDSITFSLSGTILLSAALPTITDPAGLIIDGVRQTITIDGNGAVRPFTIAADASLELRAVTVTRGGVSTAFPSSGHGGGIYNNGALTLTNSTVSGNDARCGFRGSAFGGGIVNLGTLTVTNSTVSGNTSCDSGGGIYNSGTLTLTNSTLSGNTARREGGGIANSGTLTLTNSTLSGNTTNGAGGGIYSSTGLASNTQLKVTLDHTDVQTNTASSGAGIWIGRGTLTLDDSTVTGNTATGQGGGLFAEGGTAELTTSLFEGNHATDGGGIFADTDATVTLDHSDVQRNRARGHGGGLFVAGGTLTLWMSTDNENTATGNGGGVYASGGTAYLTDSEVRSNQATDGGGIFGTGSATVKLDHTDVQTNTATGNGGGIAVAGGAVMLWESTDNENTATGSGGGLYASGGATYLTNSELRGNRAADGGAIFSTPGAVVTLDHTDVEGNSPPQCQPAALCSLAAAP